MKRTSTQNTEFHALIGKLSIDKERKEDLVFEYSEGRCTSSADLLYTEMAQLIIFLRKQTTGTFLPGNNQRKKILSLFHELGYELPGGKIDWKRVNGWLMKYGYLHKGLNDYTLKELPKLVSQVERIQTSNYDQH